MDTIKYEVTIMDSNDYIVKYRKDRKLSQKSFAELYDVPLSTLRKWEQKESTPSKFFIEMLKKNEEDNHLIKIENDNKVYFFDLNKMIIYDNLNNGIRVNRDITKLNRNNLFIMLNQLYEDYYKAIERFEILCTLDEKGNSKWRELK